MTISGTANTRPATSSINVSSPYTRLASPPACRPRGTSPAAATRPAHNNPRLTSEIGHRVEHAYDLVLERVWLVVQAVAGAELGEAPPVCSGRGRRGAVRRSRACLLGAPQPVPAGEARQPPAALTLFEEALVVYDCQAVDKEQHALQGTPCKGVSRPLDAHPPPCTPFTLLEITWHRPLACSRVQSDIVCPGPWHEEPPALAGVPPMLGKPCAQIEALFCRPRGHTTQYTRADFGPRPPPPLAK